MLIPFALGYLFGLVFYAAYFPFLIALSRRTGRRPAVGWLTFGRWTVMPILVGLAAYLTTGEIDATCGAAVAGYLLSLLVRLWKVSRGLAPGDEEVLETIESAARRR